LDRCRDRIGAGQNSSVPYEKENQDNSLEMNAQFQVARPGVWLLNRVESAFRGDGGSTGRVKVVTADADAFEPIRELLLRQGKTADILQRLAAGKSRLALEVKPGEGQDVALAAEWTAAAKESAAAQQEGKVPAVQPLIGIYRARAIAQPDGGMRLELAGITTASWKEFETEWTATSESDSSKAAQAKARVEVRTEGTPGAFTVQLELPASSGLRAAKPLRVELSGTVVKMTAGYHGHGMWFRFANGK
jgi:hypothetical protein